MTMSEESLKVAMRGISAQYEEVLSKYHLIDIGIVKNYSPEGNVDILALYLNNGTPVEYKGVEVWYVGTNEGAFTCVPEGSLCLLLSPMVIAPNSSSLVLDRGESPFGNKGMKAIPITRGDNTTLKTGFDRFGNFYIMGEGLNINITKKEASISFGTSSFSMHVNEGLTATLASGKLFLSCDENGELTYLYFDDDEVPQCMVNTKSDGTLVVKRNALGPLEGADWEDLSAFNKWRWQETYNTDGSVSKSLQQEEDKPLLTREISSDGNITDTLSKDSGMLYTINVGDDVSIKIDGGNKSISFTTGDTTEEKKDGGWEINVNGPITLKSTTADKIMIQNLNSSLYKVLNDIISVLNGGSCATQGSPAAHTITPGQFSTALTDLQALTGE